MGIFHLGICEELQNEVASRRIRPLMKYFCPTSYKPILGYFESIDLQIKSWPSLERLGGILGDDVGQHNLCASIPGGNGSITIQIYISDATISRFLLKRFRFLHWDLVEMRSLFLCFSQIARSGTPTTE